MMDSAREPTPPEPKPAEGVIIETGRRGLPSPVLRVRPAYLSGLSILFMLGFLGISRLVQRGALTEVDSSVGEAAVASRNTPLTILSFALTIVGSAPGVALVLLGYLRRRRDERPLSRYLILQTIGLGIVNELVKLVFRRTRPPYRMYPEINSGYPSAHASAGIAFFGLLAVLSVAEEDGEVLPVGAIALFVPLVGLSRVYLGVHWLSDVLAGYVLGASYLCASLAVLEAGGLENGERKGRPVRPPVSSG